MPVTPARRPNVRPAGDLTAEQARTLAAVLLNPADTLDAVTAAAA